MKCPTCEHRVSPEPPKYHDKDLCGRLTELETLVAQLQATIKDTPAAAVEQIIRRQRAAKP